MQNKPFLNGMLLLARHLNCEVFPSTYFLPNISDDLFLSKILLCSAVCFEGNLNLR